MVQTLLLFVGPWCSGVYWTGRYFHSREDICDHLIFFLSVDLGEFASTWDLSVDWTPETCEPMQETYLVSSKAGQSSWQVLQ